MASEILFSGLSGDLALASILHQEMNLLLADRASMANHPAISYLGDVAGRGSTALEVGLVGLDGSDLMGSVAENGTPSNTALPDASPAITIARQALQYQISDLATLTSSLGLDADRLAESMVGSAVMRLQEMIANVADDFTGSVGSTGVNMDVDNWFSAQYTLTQNSVPGPYVALLHPVQLTDWQSSLRSETGPLQFNAPSNEALAIKGPGYAGNFGGVDIFTSSHVPTANAGADRAGAMFGAGAIGYADGSVSAIRGAGDVVYPAGTKIVVEFERSAGYAYTAVVGSYYVGVSILEDGRGVSIITDA